MYAWLYPKHNIPWIATILCLLCLSTYAQTHPVKTWGKISSIYQELSASETGINSSSWLNIGTLNASSYIWHPWFALVNGSLSLTSSETDSDTSGPSESETIEGAFQFNLFPTSRFPFQLYASKSSFDQNRPANDRFYSQTTLGMLQSYTNLDGSQSYSAAYRRQDRDNETGNDQSTESFNLGANTRLENHDITTNLRYSSNNDQIVIDESEATFSARHNYTGSSEFSLENQLSASKFNNEISARSNDLKTQQFTSFMSWAPNNRNDLSVTGNIRMSEREQTLINRSSIINPSLTIEQKDLNLNQGLIYRMNSNVSFQESVNINQNQQASNDNVNFSESVGASYSSDTINLLLSEYNWFASSNLINQHGDIIESSVSLATQFGHNLNREYFVNPDVTIQANFGQNLNYTATNPGDNSGTLGNSVSLSWSDSNVSTKTYARFFALDTRSLNDSDNRQLLNFQATQHYQLDRFKIISTQVTLQKNRNSIDNSTTGVRLIAGQVTYTDQRFLNTRGLFFKSQLEASDNEPDDIEILNPDTQDANSISWKNEWFYRIGLFESRLSFDYIRTDNDYNQIIIIELTRNFGDL